MNTIFTTRATIFVLLTTFIIYIYSRNVGGSQDISIYGLCFFLLCYLLSLKNIKKNLLSNKLILSSCVVVLGGMIFSVLYRGTTSNSALYPLLNFMFPILIAQSSLFKEGDFLKYQLIFGIILIFSILYLDISNLSQEAGDGGLNGNNLGSIIVILSICLLLLTNLSNLIGKIAITGVIILSFTLILISHSRTSLMVFMLFLVGKFLPTRFFNKKILRFCFLFLTFGSLLFMLIYIQMYITNFNLQEYLTFLSSEKSAFSGRQFIWMEAFDILLSNPFGVGYNYIIYCFETNELHNIVLTMYIYYGVIVATAMLVLLNKVVFILIDRVDDTQIKDSLVAFGCFLFMNFTEAILLGTPLLFFPLFVAYHKYNTLLSLK